MIENKSCVRIPAIFAIENLLARVASIAVIANLLLIFTGCSSLNSLIKAEPAKPSGFIENPEELKEMREHAPFHGLWFKDREKFDETRSKYKTIYFAPVSTQFIETKGWWSNLNSFDLEEYEEDLQETARYARQSFEDAFRTDPDKRFTVTQSPADDTLVYEIALVELIATKAHINAIGTVAGALIPGGGLVKSTAKGSVAIEVKVIDAESGEVIISWADREIDQSSLFSVNDFSWYSHARNHINVWAQQLVILHHVTTKDYVEDSSGFTLNPF